MYKNKLYVMDADCLRNGSLFCRFAGKANTKMKNESITGFVANARPEETV